MLPRAAIACTRERDSLREPAVVGRLGDAEGIVRGDRNDEGIPLVPGAPENAQITQTGGHPVATSGPDSYSYDGRKTASPPGAKF